MSRFVLILCLVPLVGFGQQQTINIQVSDPANHALRGVKITTKCPGTTETTDDAGKASITYRPPAGMLNGPIELTIVAPKSLDFISPWQRSVTVPPDYWAVVLAPHGQREVLEHPKTVISLVARANHLQGRKSAEEPPPSTQSRMRAINTVAADVGLPAADVEKSFEHLKDATHDDYSRAMLSLLDHDYKGAATLFTRALEDASTSAGSASLERAVSSAYFMGQAKFELGDYLGSAAAYAKAAELRPDDPTILNNEGLSRSKAGDFTGAEKLYRRALELMQRSGETKTITYSTVTNNLAATLAYEGALDTAEELFENALQLRRALLEKDDLRIAISLNNVAAVKITTGNCTSAGPLLEEALDIQNKTLEDSEGQEYQVAQKGISAQPNFPEPAPAPQSSVANPPQTGVANSISASPPMSADQRGISANPPGKDEDAGLIGYVPVSSTPGIFTTRTNQAMLAYCVGDLSRARAILLQLRDLQFLVNPPKSDLGNTLFDLARVEQGLGNIDGALSDYRASISVYERTLGRDHPALSQVLVAYGRVLLKQGKTSEGDEALRRALAIENRAFGSNSSNVKKLSAQIQSMEHR